MISLFLEAPEMKVVLLVNYNIVARVRVDVLSYTILAMIGHPRFVRCCAKHINSVTVNMPNPRCTTSYGYFESPSSSSTFIHPQS